MSRPKNQAEADAALKARSCGGCTACCTGMAVSQIAKPVEAPCPHQLPDGCSIYETRPDACRDFHCLWRMGFGRLMERPDRAGYFLDVTKPGGAAPQMMIAREAWAGAFDSAHVRGALDRISGDKLLVLVRGSERKLIGPAHLVSRIRAKR